MRLLRSLSASLILLLGLALPVAAQTTLSSIICPGTGCLSTTLSGSATATIQVTGDGALPLTVQGTTASGTYVPIVAQSQTTPALPPANTITAGIWIVDTRGLTTLRVVRTRPDGTTPVVTVGTGASASTVAIDQSNSGTTNAVVCASGCSGGTSDSDDASIAVSQTTGLSLGLTQVYDGSVWRRLTIGTAGTASAQVLTVQGVASMTKLLVTPDANSAVNVAQINGVTTTMGNGVSGTGVQRVTIASDSTGSVAISNGGATGTIAGTSSVAYVAPLVAGTIKSSGTASMTGTTSTSVIAGTASNYTYVSSCSVSNIHASVDTLVDLQDGSGGTVLWTFVAVHGYGGESHTFGTPLKVPTIGNGLFAVDETTGAAVKIFCNGFYTTLSN